MKVLIGIVLAGAVVSSASQAASGSSVAGGRGDSIAVPGPDWASFISTLDQSLGRIIPEVNGAHHLVAIRYFYVRVPPAERMGIVSGDRFVAVNGVKVEGTALSANRFLHGEMKRSAASCTLSSTIESAGSTHTVGAHCDRR
jgi:hypothetical protein